MGLNSEKCFLVVSTKDMKITYQKDPIARKFQLSRKAFKILAQSHSKRQIMSLGFLSLATVDIGGQM